MIVFYTAPLLSFVTTYCLLYWMISKSKIPLPVDNPNSRSLHTAPVPRIGGIGVLAGITSGVLVTGAPLSGILLACTLLLTCVSFRDDWKGVPVVWRLATHLSAAVIVASDMLFFDYGIYATLIVALGLVWMTNLYNFMDGSDGLAGGMAMFGFSFYAIAAFASGNMVFGWMNASIAAAAAAFLLFNFHPARIFLGDVGSVPLGFLAATFGIVGWLQHNWTWWFPVLVFAPFIVDASATLARRLASGARVWEAHRDHYYQRLVQMGLGHRTTALAEYVLMLISGAAALWALTLSAFAQKILLSLMGLLYIALIALIARAWSVRRNADG